MSLHEIRVIKVLSGVGSTEKKDAATLFVNVTHAWRLQQNKVYIGDSGRQPDCNKTQ